MANVLYSAITARSQAFATTDKFAINQVISAANKTRLATIGDLKTFIQSASGTAFTAGSMVFAGASGVYSQDNANLNYNTTTHVLTIGGGISSGSVFDISSLIPGARGTLARVDFGINNDYVQWSFRNNSNVLGAQFFNLGYWTLTVVANEHLTFGTNNTERMRILDAGRILMGTTTDDGSRRLQVSGDIAANSGSDYVRLNATAATITIFKSGVEGITMSVAGGYVVFDKGFRCSGNSNVIGQTLIISPDTPASQTAGISLFRSGYVDWNIRQETTGTLSITNGTLTMSLPSGAAATVTGNRLNPESALKNLLSALATIGFLIDGTTAT